MFGFNANMKVSFKGINNINITQNRIADYPATVYGADNSFYKTSADVEEIKLTCHLDDNDKSDLNDYYIFLAKYKNCKKYQPVSDKFNSLELQCNDINVEFSGNKYNKKYIFLNGLELDIDDDTILPLITYLASLTKRISLSENINSTEKIYIKKLNAIIHKKACDYLDINV